MVYLLGRIIVCILGSPFMYGHNRLHLDNLIHEGRKNAQSSLLTITCDNIIRCSTSATREEDMSESRRVNDQRPNCQAMAWVRKLFRVTSQWPQYRSLDL